MNHQKNNLSASQQKVREGGMRGAEGGQAVLEDNITMEQHPVSEARQFKPSRTELASPDTDWDRSWHLARLKGLGPESLGFCGVLWRPVANDWVP